MEEKGSRSRVKKTIGCYRFTVEGYSALSTKIGDSVESPEFCLCGHDWQLRLFPGGSLEAHKGYLSFYLASKSTRVARASYKLALTSQVIGGIDETFASSGVRTFEAKGVQVDGWGRDKFMTLGTLMDADYGYCVNDVVIFKVEITVVGDLECTIQLPPVIVDESYQKCMATMMKTTETADITIKLGGGHQLTAHRCILCARSPVFRAMLLTSEMTEAATGIIDIVDIDVSVFAEMLSFLYTDELTEQATQAMSTMSEDLLFAGAKYQIQGLVSLCEDYLSQQITAETVTRLLILADHLSASRLKEKAFHFIAQHHSSLLMTKEFGELDGELLAETKAVVDLAMKRKGCRGNSECEKKFGNICTIM